EAPVAPADPCFTPRPPRAPAAYPQRRAEAQAGPRARSVTCASRGAAPVAALPDRAPHNHRPGPPQWPRWLPRRPPLMIIVQGLRSGLVGLRDVVLPAAPRILAVDPAQFLIVGHRGACASVVENTLASCEHAVEVEGADAVEIDLCVTK